MLGFRRIGSWLLLLLLLCLFSGGSSGAGQAPSAAPLELVFRVDKATYQLYDRVPTYFIFRNRSSDVVVVNVFCMVGEPSDCEFRFNVTSPSGKPAPPAGVREPTFPGLFAGRFLRIPPGQTGGQEVDLSLYVRLEEEGVYRVAASYTNRLSGRTSAGPVWMGTLQAPARTFRMVKEHSSR